MYNKVSFPVVGFSTAIGEIEILPVDSADLPELLALQKEAFRQEAERTGDPGIAPLRQTPGSMEEDFRSYTFLKAVCDGKIIGSVRSRCKEGDCLVGRLAVLPQYQGKGTGRKLLAAAEREHPDAERFILFTEPNSTINIRFYESAGYVNTYETIPDTCSGLPLVKLVKQNNPK